jgi:hypothetical protein
MKNRKGSSMLTPIPEILEELKHGRMIILVDDEDRENEGDLVCAAESVTPEIVNFMATHGRGLICMPMEKERPEKTWLASHGIGKHCKIEYRFSHVPLKRRKGSPRASAPTTAPIPYWWRPTRRPLPKTWSVRDMYSPYAPGKAACWCAPARRKVPLT